MRIFFAAGELAPFAKVGGLADVVGSLPKALKRLGADVTVLFPKYAEIDEEKYQIKPTGETMAVVFGEREETLTLWETTLPDSDVPVILFDHPDWIGNGGVYAESEAKGLPGVEPNLPRFLLFSAAAAKYVSEHSDNETLFHCHDWHLAASIPFLKNHFGAGSIKTLFTIHNLAYQGGYGFEQVRNVLGDDLTKSLPKESLLQGGTDWYNLMLSAILTSDWISTVSPTYRNEILTEEYGVNLETYLQGREDKLVGVVNGIDTKRWDPKTDPSLEKTYDKSSLEIKAENKKLLQKELGLPVGDTKFIVGMVSRIAEQKGYDILDPALPVMFEDMPDMQFIMLGTGDPQYTADLKALEERFPDSMVFVDRFDEDLAHRIYAASDTFYMPSRFEPCGLGQLFAMRYGTLPIARATGGLKDTVIAKETGFVFNEYTADGVTEATKEAAKLFAEDKEAWKKMVINAMERDSSWDASAEIYLKLYQKMFE